MIPTDMIDVDLSIGSASVLVWGKFLPGRKATAHSPEEPATFEVVEVVDSDGRVRKIDDLSWRDADIVAAAITKMGGAQ
jgi:hypothetical protein